MVNAPSAARNKAAPRFSGKSSEASTKQLFETFGVQSGLAFVQNLARSGGQQVGGLALQLPEPVDKSAVLASSEWLHGRFVFSSPGNQRRG